ncbi:MAG: hypothetical protein PHT10_08995, partial [Aminobacterium sp.]|nr:hypothetical protein [Aminobacterium sp.]
MNLLEALIIVIAILLIFMGIRSGMLIGGVLLLTILATFIAMKRMFLVQNRFFQLQRECT